MEAAKELTFLCVIILFIRPFNILTFVSFVLFLSRKHTAFVAQSSRQSCSVVIRKQIIIGVW